MEIISKVHDLYRQGMGRERISGALGISYSSVRRYTDPRYEFAHTRRVRTFIDGVRHRTRVEKRPRPSNCELCGNSAKLYEKILSWHHWNAEHLEWGLWVCPRCHIGTEFVEQGRDKKYQELKEAVECSA